MDNNQRQIVNQFHPRVQPIMIRLQFNEPLAMADDDLEDCIEAEEVDAMLQNSWYYFCSKLVAVVQLSIAIVAILVLLVENEDIKGVRASYHDLLEAAVGKNASRRMPDGTVFVVRQCLPWYPIQTYLFGIATMFLIDSFFRLTGILNWRDTLI